MTDEAVIDEAATDGLSYRSGADRPTRRLPTLEPAMAARAVALLAGPLASVHEHPVRLPEPLTAQTWARHLGGMTDRLADDELAASGLDLVVAACFSQPRFEFVVSWARSLASQVSDRAGLSLVAGAADLAFAGPEPDGLRTVRVMLCLEDLGIVDTVDDIDTLAAIGIAVAGVAYNTGSKLGCGLGQDDTGLTAFGRQAIARMNELGIAVDVSHAGRRTSLEAIAASTRPVVINHAGAAGLWASPRMVTDEVILAAAESGGLIGIEAAPGSTRTRLDAPTHTVDDVVSHIEYCAELAGVTAVAVGGDTFYGDHVGLYRATGSSGAALPTGAVPFSGDRVDGADHPGETVRQVCHSLLLRGWSDDDIALVIGGNAFRVHGEVLAGVRP